MPELVLYRFPLNMIPTLIDCEGLKMLVYSSITTGEGPSLYFYSLKDQCTFAMIRQAEVFVDCVGVDDNTSTEVVYLEGETLVKHRVKFKDALLKSSS